LHRLIPIIVSHKGFKCAEIPVKHQMRKFGKSKYKLIRHRGLLDIIALATATTTQIRPFHFFCELAFVFWVLAFLSFVLWIVTIDTLPMAIQILVAGFGIWSTIVGTFLPFWGFSLEISASRHQGKEWRQGLIEKILNADSKRKPVL